MSFSTFDLAAPLLEAVRPFPAPTPVQTEAIPSILAGRDTLVTARTGSGKTVAFVLPLLQRWLTEDSTTGRSRHLHSLILVPTRELAAQVRSVVQDCSAHLPRKVKVVSAVGGVSINPQMMALRGGADIVVATPGRLLDLVEKNALSISGIETLVLDEADRLLDLGFSDELTRIFALLPSQRQNLLFSATFPKKVEALAREWLVEPERIAIAAEEAESAEIEQRAIRVDTGKRTSLLLHLLSSEKWSRVLVFVATQYSADHVVTKLRRKGIRTLSFHGDLSQGARTDVLEGLKSSRLQVVVATDLAARGLDIERLPVVVNYDLPRSANDYTHRIGRTGRAGETGVAISFITAKSEGHFRLIEKRNRVRVPREEVEGFEPIEVPPEKGAGTGGIKGRRKSKKDKLREAAAREQKNKA